ncbi:phosphoribosylanthranilate isomerase [Ruficoccus sp. ZRK36]|uniref:phosphoribosylanthranilate isomerase n=1 Tax=Ruficoccus sp. ZRK36 TaxID=2866311 RepID=UPI001C738B5B|nr:phosphoribosylanthranilate isomerase [Ruficoccus sp. ZRK36]QYY35597.1 phosphoribosylanthranilate isomerase [Ruficoccus sp. ZRK36]
MINDLTVKVCGITRMADAELALELGADYVGMICYAKSPRSVTLEQARDLCNRIPAGKRVFVDVATGTDELENFADLGFDAFQLHFDLDLGLATVAAWSGIVGAQSLWLAPRLPEGEEFPQAVLEFADTVVLDSPSKGLYGGTGKTGNWERFAELSTLYQHKRWVLAGGLGPDNVAEAVRKSGATMIDVNSGVESQPGIKDHAKLRDLFAALKE